MGYDNSRSVRFQEDHHLAKLPVVKGDGIVKLNYKINGNKLYELKVTPEKTGKSLKAKVLQRVFSEDFERVKRKILDPQGQTIHRWNKIFLVACLVSLFVDPLFFYLPVVREEQCVDIGKPLEVGLTVVRSVADVFYIIQMFVRLHTAYVAPSSRVFGRGELVIDSSKITSRYLRKDFWIDLIAALPLPQVLIWLVIPNLKGSTMTNARNVLCFIITFQYIPRLFIIYPLSSQIVKATGVVTGTAWAGAAYNLMFFMLASHVVGACWYLLSIQRQEACWRRVCDDQKPSCEYSFFDCHRENDFDRTAWFQSSNLSGLCNPSSGFYMFGIYGDAVTTQVNLPPFINQYFYCLWWGLKSLCCLGQNLSTSPFVGENIFAIIVGTLGLVLFALLIGNMQRYLQYTTVRLEEWRINRTDTEQWMHDRHLPPDLKQSVRKHDQFRWIATGGVGEDTILKGLPRDLRRDIKRHLCLDLVRRVPLFDQMDERMLDAICERLKPSLCTEGTFLMREGDPVNEMLFIIRGHLDSYTTNGGRPGFFNSCRIGPGDFCGEELLTWVLDPRPRVILPSSTQTVKSITEVEAFALNVEDLKFVASQFPRLHSKQQQHRFRFYSHHWRTWAACFIQVAWRQFKKRKEVADLKAQESFTQCVEAAEKIPTSSGLASCATRLAASTRIGGGHSHSDSDSSAIALVQKPAELDFSVGDD